MALSKPAHSRLSHGNPMTQESVTYLTNTVIGVILAGLLMQAWWRAGRSGPLRYWMAAAWIMVVADVLFALRPGLPYWFGRLGPTLLVTTGHATLFLGARATARRAGRWNTVVAVTLAHGMLLVFFLVQEQFAAWRMVGNGAVWAVLSFLAYGALRGGAAQFWRPVVSPATVFLVHGGFHCLRAGLAGVGAGTGWADVDGPLQLAGDLEVSFFMVALFVSLLLATLEQRHEELSSTRAEVQTLSGLLPICAWCKKVRDDAGYWEQVEDYFARRDKIEFTHGICSECAEEQTAKLPRK